MKLYITGGAKCGKSTLAQDTVFALSGREGRKHYYLATMIPVDAEDEYRIRRHIEDRDGMGFETIERGRDICGILDTPEFDPEGVYLLDSVTALYANEMFGTGQNASAADACTAAGDGTAGADTDAYTDLTAAKRVAADLIRLASAVRHIVFVSDGIFSDAALYDDFTEKYREGLAYIDRSVAAVCDLVAECVYGNIMWKKGASNANREVSKMNETESAGKDRIALFVFGGAYQGKRNFIKEIHGISDRDIHDCAENSTEIPADICCVAHAERYVLACVRTGKTPDITAFANRPDRIVLCDDISSGVVPVDPEMRKWREETGRFMNALSKSADEVVRLCAGIPQTLKP